MVFSSTNFPFNAKPHLQGMMCEHRVAENAQWTTSSLVKFTLGKRCWQEKLQLVDHSAYFTWKIEKIHPHPHASLRTQDLTIDMDRIQCQCRMPSFISISQTFYRVLGRVLYKLLRNIAKLKKLSNFQGKIRENVPVFHILGVDNFNFTRKIVDFFG